MSLLNRTALIPFGFVFSFSKLRRLHRVDLRDGFFVNPSDLNVQLKPLLAAGLSSRVVNRFV